MRKSDKLRGIIGSIDPLHAGFGNRLLHFITLRQLANRFGTTYFHNGPRDSRRILGMHSPRRLRVSTGPRVLIDASEFKFGEPMRNIGEILNEGRNVVINGSLLGEAFAGAASAGEVAFPKNLMSQCDKHRRFQQGSSLIALHFRGNDFATWNPMAILPTAYYVDAIRRIRNKITGTLIYRLCTDDRSLSSFQETQAFLVDEGLTSLAFDCTNSLECDFSAMASSTFLVSSPSTFAITAAMLGNPHVIHSGEWVADREEKGEQFWKMVRTRSLPGCRVYDIL